MHANSPGLTTHLAVLDVILITATSGIESDHVLLAAVRTHYGSGCVRRSVSKREFFVEVVREIDHRSVRFLTLRTGYTSNIGTLHHVAYFHNEQTGAIACAKRGVPR